MKGKPAQPADLREEMKSFFALAEENPEAYPLTVTSVAKHLGVDRTVLIRHGLNEEVKEEAARQAGERNVSPKAAERRQYADQLRSLEEKLQQAELRNRELLGRIQLAEYNARVEGWDTTKLWRPMPPTERSAPRTHPRRR
ncbi:MAG: hypothetical protein WD737_10725 [Gemmatimonadota bacterium]